MYDPSHVYMILNVILTIFSNPDVCIPLASSVPALFVFGDSLVDVGNNNYIKTLSKANFEPNGIDFGEPTGRFTNGRTMADILGQKIGVSGWIPPYLAPSTEGSVVLKGVNYASGSAGILNDTGKIFIRNINMDAQTDNFANTRQTIISLKGKSAGVKLLKTNALFFTVIGSNDFINNYLIPIISRKKQKEISPQSFVFTLITRFRTQLTRLYELDARKFILANVAPIGCIPYMKSTNPTNPGGCFERANTISQMFNMELEKLIAQLRQELKGSVFVYINTYHIFSDIVQNYETFGFQYVNKSCCRVAGSSGGLIPCTRLSHVCEDRSKYVFWDSYHPTDASNALIAQRVFQGKAPDVSPMNVKELMRVPTS